MSKKWTLEELEKSIKTNLSGDCYGCMVSTGALFKKLYGVYPKIGLSGNQALYVDCLYDYIPDLVDKQTFEKIEKFLTEQKEFSIKTFEATTDISGVMAHLREETREVEKSPNDIEEWADCFILLLDGLWRKGFNFTQLFEATLKKFEKNKKRKWGKPDKDGIIRHIKTEV